MARRRRRRRVKYFVGGGVILVLLLLLGDPYGVFRPAERGAVTGAGTERGAGPRAPAPEVERRPGTPPDGVAAGGAGAADPGRRDPGGPVAPTRTRVEDVRLAGDGPGDRPATGTEDVSAALVARLDRTVGLIHRFEQALAEDRLADLAVLVDRQREHPTEPPPALVERWRSVQDRAERALRCGDRLRALLGRGEVLQARRLLLPLLQPAAPDWMRQRLDAAAAGFGWPALSRSWRLGPAATGSAGTPLRSQRRVRFVKDGELQEGEIWRHDAGRITLRIRGRDGFTFPAVPADAVEPVDPEPAEALAQGLAAAGQGDPIGVMLWSCVCQERGASAAAQRLRALLRSP